VIRLLALLLAGGWVSAFAREPQVAANAPADRPNATTQSQQAALDRALQPLLAQARATYPAAKKRFVDGLPPDQGFFITTNLRDEDGKTELVFVAVESIENGIVAGRIWNQIVGVRGYQLGDSYRFPESVMVDWLITHPDGSEEGNVVGKFLDTYAPQ
jgi:hypothetical protein